MDFGLNFYRPGKQKLISEIQNILVDKPTLKTWCLHIHIVSVSSALLKWKPIAIFTQILKRNRNSKNS